MKNLYQPSKLFSEKEFKKLEYAFACAWHLDTTYPEAKEEWSDDNKALGQCAPTAVVVCDLYGGRIIFDEKNFHLWNELPDGTEQDLSRSQFKNERVFTVSKYKTKEEVLYGNTGTKTDLFSRYLILKKRVENLITGKSS